MKKNKNTTKEIILICSAVLIVALGAYYYLHRPAGNQIACTQEALLCPDGSYVARHGAQCAFDACPAGTFSGELRQAENGFKLIMESPAEGTEVTYALPLRIDPAEAPLELVGQKVDVSGTFTEGNTLQVEQLEVSSGTVDRGTVGVGKTVFINGVRITLNGIVGDSRCPVGVQCIQAGSVTANVTLKSDTDSETRDINSGTPSVPFDSFLISLERVTPSRKAGSEPDAQEYSLTFRVVSSSETVTLASELAKCLPMSDWASKERCDALLAHITDFDTCVSAGFPVLESNPPQCQVLDGKTFTESLSR